jgi:hypothetical protein
LTQAPPVPPVLDPKVVERKLRIMSGLFMLAFRTKIEQFRKKHPELDDRALNHRAYALIEQGSR